MDLSRDSGLLQEEQRVEERRPAAPPFAIEAEPEVLRSKALVREVPAEEPEAPAPENETAVAERVVKAEDGVLSRDLIDTYFRQMGGRELLSREGEIALAKRIEAAQLALLKHLFSVPMVVGQIVRWGEEVREEQRSLRDFVDLSQSDGEPAATEGGEPKPAAATDEQPEPDARDAAIIARIRKLSAPANEIAKLAKARVDAAVRGRNISKERRERLEALLAKFAGAMAAVRLHPDRLVDLIAMVDHELRTLRQVERDLHRLGKSAPAELHETKMAVARRVGLPIDAFSATASAVTLNASIGRPTRRASAALVSCNSAGAALPARCRSRST